MMPITPFNFGENSIRVVSDENGEPLFVGKDVCAALGYADATTAIRAHCKGVQKQHPLQTAGGVQEMRVLAEPDVLRLIVSCSLPAAQAFERLVFEEILPAIRKTGKYAMSAAPALPQSFAAALRLAADQQDVIAQQSEQLVAAAPKVEFVDKYVEAAGLNGFRETAKLIEANEAEFRRFLLEEGVMYYLHKKLTPYAPHLDADRFAIRTHIAENGRACNQSYFTAKGVEWVVGQFARWQHKRKEVD